MYHLGSTVKNENTGYEGEMCRVGSMLFCARYSGKALIPSAFEQRPEEHEGGSQRDVCKRGFQAAGARRREGQSPGWEMPGLCPSPRTCKELSVRTE